MAGRLDCRRRRLPFQDPALVNRQPRNGDQQYPNPSFISQNMTWPDGPSQRRPAVCKPLPIILGIDMINEAITEIDACTSEGVKSSLARLQDNVRPAAARLDHHTRGFEQQLRSGKKTGLCWIEKQIEAADAQVAVALLTEVRLMASICKQKHDAYQQDSRKAAEAAALSDDSKRLQMLYTRLSRWWRHGKDVEYTRDQIGWSGKVSEEDASPGKQRRKRQRSDVDADADEFDHRARPLKFATATSNAGDQEATGYITDYEEPNMSGATYKTNIRRYSTYEPGPAFSQQPDLPVRHRLAREPTQAQSLRELDEGAQRMQNAARVLSQSIPQPETQNTTLPHKASLPRPSNVATAVLRALGKHPTLPPLNHGLGELLCRKEMRKHNPTANLDGDRLALAQDRVVRDVQEWWRRKRVRQSA